MFSNAKDYVAITPSNTVDQVYDAIWVGTGGNLRLTSHRGNQVIFSNVGDGKIVPCACKRVLAAGTTATNLVGLTYNP